MDICHDGHLSLVRRARAESDVVVVSLFVDPAQFGPGEASRPIRGTSAVTAALAEAEGADLLFAPSTEEVYPDGLRHVGDRERPDRGDRAAIRPGAARSTSPA